jgi:NAD(P)-dependent dehydrogenase (short-subunit alcohol dehydrogenase family)
MGYGSSKTALNAITVAFAKELAPRGVKVNAAGPGYTATDLNGHRGRRTVQQAAEIVVRLARRRWPDRRVLRRRWYGSLVNRTQTLRHRVQRSSATVKPAETPMTDDSTNAQALLRKSVDADFVREIMTTYSPTCLSPLDSGK